MFIYIYILKHVLAIRGLWVVCYYCYYIMFIFICCFFSGFRFSSVLTNVVFYIYIYIFLLLLLLLLLFSILGVFNVSFSSKLCFKCFLLANIKVAKCICANITLSLSHPITLSSYHRITQSHCDLIMRSLSAVHLIALSHYSTTIWWLQKTLNKIA